MKEGTSPTEKEVPTSAMKERTSPTEKEAPTSARKEGTSQIEKETRTSWTIEETLALVDVVHSEGKTWAKVLNILKNDRHLCTNVSDWKQLRKKWNTLTKPNNPLEKRAARKPTRLQLSRSERQRLTQEEIKRKEAELAQRQQHEVEECHDALEKIKEVEKRETLLLSNKRKKEEEVKEEIEEEEDKKRAKREERFQKWEEQQQNEAHFRVMVTKSLETTNRAIEQLVTIQQQFLNTLPLLFSGFPAASTQSSSTTSLTSLSSVAIPFPSTDALTTRPSTAPPSPQE